jgi:hypothetical protein
VHQSATVLRHSCCVRMWYILDNFLDDILDGFLANFLDTLSSHKGTCTYGA